MTDKQHPEWMGKNRKLTPAEVKEFLAEPVVARIATIDEAGVPYVTPVWQEWDGEAFWMVVRERAAWIAHIKKNANVGISCAQDSGTYRRIVAQGKAEIVSGPAPMQGECLGVANRTSVRYLGERGPEYLVPTYDRPRYLIKIVPTKMLTWDGVEWARKIRRNNVRPRLASERVHAVDAPRIVVEKRGLLGFGKILDDGLEAVEDGVVARP